MDNTPIKRIQYNDETFYDVMDKLKVLKTFAEVSTWDHDAQLELGKIIKVIKDLDRELADEGNSLEKAKQIRAEKNLLTRVFQGHKEEKKVIQHSEQCRNNKIQLTELANQLQESIDFSPNNMEEQKTLVKELRLRKKGLLVKKREVAAIMTELRTQARQLSAEAGKVGFFYSSKTAAVERRSIRYAKEDALRPHENNKTAIERQLIQVDKDILWAERFAE